MREANKLYINTRFKSNIKSN